MLKIGVLLSVKNKIIKNKDHIFRVLEVKDNQYLIVDCRKLRMPKWIPEDDVKDYVVITEEELLEISNVSLCNYDDLNNDDKKITNDRFGSISIIINNDIRNSRRRISFYDVEICRIINIKT